jgi:hypothetical protein
VTIPGTIFFRADHELVGRVIAEKRRRHFDRSGAGDAVRIDPRHRRPRPAVRFVAEELQREPADPLMLEWAAIVRTFRRAGVAFAAILTVALIVFGH